MIEGGTRSHTAVAEGEVVTYSLSRANLDTICERDPSLYRRLLLNMVSHMSGLLRMTTTILRDTSEAVD
jgi:CRP-like cAMP-binding protein